MGNAMQETAGRVASIDVFRGIAILLMVLFTLMNMLTKETGFFVHNIQGEAHPGDFVLPLFLFASGLSLPFYVRKRMGNGAKAFWMDVVERFGFLFGLAMLLSPFSSGVLFGMDEVSLSAILFLFTVATMGFIGQFGIFHSALLAIAYFVLQKAGMTPVFDSAYIGGYQGAIFYLPVMLAGAWLGKGLMQGMDGWKKSVYALSGVALLSSLALVLVFPVDKMRVSPSFMALSVVAATVIFAIVHGLSGARGLRSSVLEFLGKNPIRYWVLMFAFFIIPYEWCVVGGVCTYPMNNPVLPSLLFVTLFMAFMAVASFLAGRLWERTWPRLRKIIPS